MTSNDDNSEKTVVLKGESDTLKVEREAAKKTREERGGKKK